MKKYLLIFLLILAIGIVSCSYSTGEQGVSLENQSSSPDNYETPTKSVTPSPLPSATMTETAVPTATPMGGKPLRIAYLSFNCEEIDSQNCIIVADFFTNEVKFKIPVNELTTDAHISWSPDGKHLLYTDRWDSYVNAMLLDVETQESVVIDTYLLRMPTILVSDTGSVKKYSVFVPDNNISISKWSPDGKYVAYKTAFSSEEYSIFIYSVEDHENKKLKNFLLSYYWLDDSEHLLEIKTGHLYNVKTDELSVIPYAYFMDASTISGDYVNLAQGESSHYPDTISLLPYSNDLDRLKEEGTGILYEDEIVIAKAYQENPKADLVKRYSISVNNYFIQGNEIILSGYIRREKPWLNEPYIKFGKMDELPLIISKDDLFEGNIFMISPDEKFFFGSDTVWEKDIFTEEYTRISLIDCFDLETKELIHSYDMHTLADDPHELRYRNNRNLAFYWEE